MAINTNNLTLPEGLRPLTPPKSREPSVKIKESIQGRFLKGPIPLVWLTTASCLPGKTLQVAIVLWFLSGVKKTRVFPLPNKILKEFGVDRFAKKRALTQLKNAGLISVSQSVGRSPVVSILDFSSRD